EMREGAFQTFTAEAQQALAASAANAPAIAIDRVARLGVLRPIPAAPIRLREVGADAPGLELDERVVAVIALVADHLLETVPLGQHRLDLFGGLNQRLSTGRRIPFIGILDGHAHDGTRFQVDRLLGFVSEMRAAILPLSIL